MCIIQNLMSESNQVLGISVYLLSFSFSFCFFHVGVIANFNCQVWIMLGERTDLSQFSV